MDKSNESSASTSSNKERDKDQEAPESKTRRLMEKDDSGISVEKSGNSSEDESKKRPQQTSEEASTSVSDLFSKMRSRPKTRNYRKATNESISDSDSDDEPEVNAVHHQPPEPEEEEQEEEEVAQVAAVEEENDSSDSNWQDIDDSSNSSSVESIPDSPDHQRGAYADLEDAPTPEVLLKQKPKHKWNMVQEIINRQLGSSSKKQSPQLMHARFYGSLHAVQRLELMYKMEAHNGCVNALNFNPSGTKLASGSDDLKVVVWDWARGKSLFEFPSGHRNNVFQAKFMPLTGDTHIVTCARDGQIRLAVLSATGSCRSTRKLAHHNQSAHKLAVLNDPPQVVLSAGEDAYVFSIDLREPRPSRLLYVSEGESKVALYSISSNPLENNEFCVGGRDQYVRIYDRRKIAQNGEALKKFCPHHLIGRNMYTHVTCAVYNHNGSEIVASYNDDDIFLFDARHSDGAEFVHRYGGHRNSATVKGISFFGPQSEYIVSGSDCAHVYFWDKHTECIVQWLNADENGVVNCLEPHPHIPVIATSGLDDDVKVWVPSFEEEPALKGLKTTVITNLRNREEEASVDPNSFDSQMLWFLWRQIQRTDGPRRGFRPLRRRSDAAENQDQQENGEAQVEDTSSSDESPARNDDSDDEDGDESGRVQCAPS